MLFVTEKYYILRYAWYFMKNNLSNNCLILPTFLHTTHKDKNKTFFVRLLGLTYSCAVVEQYY